MRKEYINCVSRKIESLLNPPHRIQVKHSFQ
nr:MAG TPA: hypothetical protein [Caudoviricetes sp.]